MDFRKEALKMLNDMSGVVSEVIQESENKDFVDVDFVLDGLDEEISKTKVEESEIPERIVEDFRPRFLGKLNESPNPREYKDGTMYKDTRTGTVYIVENGLWESLVEDGKQGAQGRSGAAGSGTGISEVKTIIESYTNSTTDSFGNVQFLGPTSPGTVSISDYYSTSGLNFLSGVPDGSIWVDDGTGEIIRKIRGQLLLEGGLLYHRQIGMSITATGTTTADAGTVLGRGGLRPIIKGGFFQDKQWTLFGKASLGISFTNTATQYFRLEILANGSILGALQIQPSSIPNVTSAVTGRIVDIYFDLAPTAAAWGNGSDVATRAHMVSLFEGGAQVGTGNSLVGLGYLMEHETYPTNINFNNDIVLTARISAPGGQTVYFNSLRWWI